jgi:hypothetical protein
MRSHGASYRSGRTIFIGHLRSSWRTTMASATTKGSQRGNPSSQLAQRYRFLPDDSALRAAQYSRIRSPTAFRCAAVIFRRLRPLAPGGVPSLIPVPASDRPRFVPAIWNGKSVRTRSGNADRISFASSASSASRAPAPRRAYALRSNFAKFILQPKATSSCKGTFTY